MYEILPYTYNRAKMLGVHVEPSQNPKYKIDVFDLRGNYITSCGAVGYSDYPHFLLDFGRSVADEHRRLYKTRHLKEIKKLGKHWAGSRSYYSWFLLW